MKKQLLIILITILSLNSYSQVSFEKGYFIDNTNQKTDCLIKTIDWNNNPTEFEYKVSEESETKKTTIKFVKEFAVNNVSKYIRAIVNIDRSSEIISKLSEDRSPKFKEEELFLLVLIEGKANLYQYIDNSLTRYFYNIEASNIEQLVFKSYKISANKTAQNNRFRQQLWTDLKCPDFNVNTVKSVDYNKKDLIQFFTEYSKCFNHDLTNFESKQKLDFFNLAVRPRLNRSSLTVQNSAFNAKDIIDFGSKTGFGIGIEAEIVLPINKNKWVLLIEPTYQSFKSEKTINDVSVIFGGELITKVDYRSIEMPLGLRYYFFLNQNSAIFINTSLVFDFSSKSSFEFDRSDSAGLETINIESEENWALGIGCNFYKKYSLEMRYQTSRELIKQNFILSSDYKTFSMILGYSLF